MMELILKWRDLILLVLFILGTLFNIIWSNRRVAAQKAHINLLQEKIKFWSEMTPSKITEYHNAIKQGLEEVINDQENKLREAEKEISQKENLLSIEMKSKLALKDKTKKLQDEITKLRVEASKTETRTHQFESLKDNLDYKPVGAWYLLFKKYDEKKLKKFWKHLESEAWEDLLDMSVEQEKLWADPINENQENKK